MTGTVVALRVEPDGDIHIDLALDQRFARLLNRVNRASQGGALVVEFMARDGGHLPAPSSGDHLALTGAWVNDTAHGWNELHPVWAEQINGGATHSSGPQFGGSPAADRSNDAAADCRTERGTECQGYGTPTAAGRSDGALPRLDAARPSSPTSNGAAGLHLRGGEFCAQAKEPTYEAAGYTCSISSDGRNRLHHR